MEKDRPTCEMHDIDEMGGGYDGRYPRPAWVCGNCGWVTTFVKPNWCPQCGAEVVDA